MAITLNTLSYDMDAWQNPNLVYYRGPSETSTVKDRLSLGRTAPKATALDAGVARSHLKRTKTVDIGGGVLKDIIIEVNVSVPVGAATASVDALRDDVGDLLISATGAAVVNNHDLTH